MVLTLRTDDVGFGCAVKEANNPNLKVYYYTGGNAQIRVALTAGYDEATGSGESHRDRVSPRAPERGGASAPASRAIRMRPRGTTLVPVELLNRMYPS